MTMLLFFLLAFAWRSHVLGQRKSFILPCLLHLQFFFRKKMVTTRSGQQTTLPKPHKHIKHNNVRRFLHSSALREGAEGFHRCICCLTRLELKSSADWLQCPLCRDVSHTQCLLRYCAKADTDIPRCPYCRTEEIPITESGAIDILELDRRWQVQDNLVPDSESESSDDSDSFASELSQER